jgi:hypothetical protein
VSSHRRPYQAWHFPVLRRRSARAEQLDLPTREANLFARLLRREEGGSPLERDCAELLAGLLVAAPAWRRCWFEELAALVGGPDASTLETLRFEIDTERRIGSKRDDLRIVGWSEARPEAEPVLVWTIEVKVGAPFHYSAAPAGTDPDDEDEPGLVHQLVSYDRWLAVQPAAFRAGFVLARSDRTAHLPPGLASTWRCLTWSGLGSALERGLTDARVPAEERTLLRHAAGFVRAHFGEEDVMAEEPIELEDLAFLRAFQQSGRVTYRKAERLVEALRPVYEAGGIGVDRIWVEDSFYSAWCRLSLVRRLGPRKNDPQLRVGVRFDPDLVLAIWMETQPKHPLKGPLRNLLTDYLPRLDGTPLRWRLTDPVAERWWDFDGRAPLEHLLTADDQARWAHDTVARGLTALRDSGLVAEIERLLEGSSDNGSGTAA